jgi:hypothetical protein
MMSGRRSQFVFSATVALAMFVFAPLVAQARCACLDTPDDVKRQADEAAALSRLPSEANRELAENFLRNHLFDDAQHYFQLAVTDAEAEAKEDWKSASSTEKMLSSFPARRAHAAAIESQAAALAQYRNQPAVAADLTEKALQHKVSLQPDFDVVPHYSELASMFERAGDRLKAAIYYGKLADALAASRGRYDEQTVAARNACQRLTAARN